MGHFLPFYPPNNPKNQNFEKMRKTPGNIITLQLCTTNDNHMMYGSWDMKCDRWNFLTFWTIFCSFIVLTIRKIKILKKWERPLAISSFYTNVSKMTIIWCIVAEIWSATDRIICHFGLVIALSPPLTTQKIKIFTKTKTKHLEMLSFYTRVPKSWSYGTWQM